MTDEATAFLIAAVGGTDALRAMAGEPIAPAVISDRFPTYARVQNRQI